MQNPEFQEDRLEGLDEFCGEMLPDLTEIIKIFIDNFFHDKELHCGGPIPKKLLYSSHYITMVINTTVSNGVLAAFKSIDRFSENENSENEVNDGTVTEDMKTVLAIQDHACERRIPKEYSGGIMLMYLELCRGIQIVDLLPEEMAEESGESPMEQALDILKELD